VVRQVDLLLLLLFEYRLGVLVCLIQGSGFRVQGSGFRVQGSRFEVAFQYLFAWSFSVAVWGFRFKVQGLGLPFYCLCGPFQWQGLGLAGFRVGRV
jgi:hypothetical protein